jgi:hypothetical protein
VAAVELLGEDGEDAPALRRVDDDRGRRRQVGDEAVLEVEGELRLGGQVGQPVAGLGSGDPAQVDVVAQPVEGDLDPSRLAGTPTRGGDVDRAILDRRRRVDGQRLAHVLPHRTPPPAPACAVLDPRRADLRGEPVADVMLVDMGSSSPSQATLRCQPAPATKVRVPRSRQAASGRSVKNRRPNYAWR